MGINKDYEPAYIRLSRFCSDYTLAEIIENVPYNYPWENESGLATLVQEAEATYKCCKTLLTGVRNCEKIGTQHGLPASRIRNWVYQDLVPKILKENFAK